MRSHYHDDDDRDDERGPGSVIAGLVAVGLVGGKRGRLALARLRRLAGRGVVLLLVGGVAGLFLLPRQAGALALILCWVGAFAAFLF